MSRKFCQVLASGTFSNSSGNFHSCSYLVNLGIEISVCIPEDNINVQRSWMSGCYQSVFIPFHWTDVMQFPRSSYLELAQVQRFPAAVWHSMNIFFIFGEREREREREMRIPDSEYRLG